MTVLNFSTVESFINYLKDQDIQRYGIVAYSRINMGEKGMGIYTEYFKLSSIDDTTKEILACEVPYYRSVFVTEAHCSKEARKPKKKMLKKIQKLIADLTEGYELKLLECEFKET
jgi:hypothetical protein